MACLGVQFRPGESAAVKWMLANILPTKIWGLDGKRSYEKVTGAAEIRRFRASPPGKAEITSE